ncbi:MAG: V-type ATP synthase subunit K [Clostridia bacterium]|nr:V-type ATP synthase subunit K [Clostridia bacterium]
MDGQVIAYIGIALCVLACGCGSAIGLYKTGQAGAGVLAEYPKKFSKVLILVVLPATNGIYGFVLAILAQGSLAGIETVEQGWRLFGSLLPLTITGFVAAIYQAKCSVASIYAVAKDDALSGKLILFPAMIETYTLLALVSSILLLG